RETNVIEILLSPLLGMERPGNRVLLQRCQDAIAKVHAARIDFLGRNLYLSRNSEGATLHQTIGTLSSRTLLDCAQEVESRTIGSTLDTTQWTLQGRRRRVVVLIWGAGTVRHREEDTALAAPALVWVPTGQ